eukprot:scaffold118494_cov34-Tisochrysis_lutea.AAC.3
MATMPTQLPPPPLLLPTVAGPKEGQRQKRDKQRNNPARKKVIPATDISGVNVRPGPHNPQRGGLG